MADIKKVTFNLADLQDYDNDHYCIRFRIASESLSEVSEWSPIFLIPKFSTI
jgi:hypothetical protein